VKGAYARLIDTNSRKEFCKFNLSRNMDNISNGNIVASISRAGNGEWSIKARGYYTRNTWTCNDMHVMIMGLLRNDYSLVKILKDGDDGRGERVAHENAGCCNIF